MTRGIAKGWVPALCALLLLGCDRREPTAPAAPPPPPAPVSGVDVTQIDAAVKPQDDFFRYVNGKWLEQTEIPSDKSIYRVFEILDDAAELNLKAIIEEAANRPAKAPGSDPQKVGDMYASFMDEARADERRLTPLAPELARIDALKDRSELPALIGRLERIGAGRPFTAYISPDAKAPTQYVIYLSQSGLGLPDRDYYLLEDAKFTQIRAAYRSHIEKILGLAGIERAAQHAKAIVALETQIARRHWTKVESREADKTYNKVELAKLDALTPGFAWSDYLRETGIDRSPGVIVRQPSYFTAFGQIVRRTELETLKVYLKWHVLRTFAPLLSKDFVDENFAFYGATLRGIQENKPRWKRAVEVVENSLGEVLGRIYVERHFPPQAKARMEGLVQNLIKAYGESIQTLDWMGEETRKRALEKLGKFRYKIGYPNKWKDYSALTIAADDLVGNVMRSNEVEHNREMAKLGGPIDREEWLMTPQTVNAYYWSVQNEIVFPAAILQPPYFNAQADDAVNYGAIGAIIGHEIGHGFDDQGSKFDGDGNLQNWWTPEDRKRFEERTKQLIGQYSAYEPIEGYKVNGALTIGENIGDLGGLSIAYKAYRLSLGGKPAPVIDGLTGDQRFFMGWAQAWRGKARDEEMLKRLKDDPHSPGEYRCNGVLVNVPEFYDAFGIKEGDRMFNPPEKRVRIW